MEAVEAAAVVFVDEGGDEIFGDAAESESAKHNRGAGGDVGDGGGGGGNDFVHGIQGTGSGVQVEGAGTRLQILRAPNEAVP